jgi:hypothetical protein
MRHTRWATCITRMPGMPLWYVGTFDQWSILSTPEKVKMYVKANPEKRRATNKKYTERNADHINEYNQNRRHTQKEKIAASSKKYRLKNREKIAESTKLYGQNNRERRLENQRKNKAKKEKLFYEMFGDGDGMVLW